MNGAEVLIEELIAQGVKTVFGYPGGAALVIYDALYQNKDRIDHVISAHEQGAVHAADGYARTSGKVGVVFSTSGPGATNLITGIANAYLDSVPLVAVTGNVSTSLLGRDSFQEVDIVGITLPIVKHSYMIKHVSELQSAVAEAFKIAKSGRPGPVLIDIPKDVQSAPCAYADHLSASVAVAKKSQKITEADYATAVKLIKDSKRPFIYAGGGVVSAEAGAELLALSKTLNAPIGLSMMGLTAVPADYPLNLGMTGMHGRFASSKAKSEADLIIAVGVRFSDRATGNQEKYKAKCKIIHVDIDRAEFNKNIKVNCELTGDAKTVLSELNGRVEPKALTEKAVSEWARLVERFVTDEADMKKPSTALSPQNLITTVNEYTTPDTLIATDVGQHQMWVMQNYKFMKTRTLLSSCGLGAMGFGLGAAIGGSIAGGNRKTILFTGDGSFGMNLNELATAVTQKLPIVIILLNNGVLGMVRQWQTAFYDKRYSETTLGRATDFVKVAQAFGAKGFRAESVAELKEILDKNYATKTPILIDCIIDKDERVLPMIPPGGSIEDIVLN